MKRIFISFLTILLSASLFADEDKAGFWSYNAATVYYDLDGDARDYVFNSSGMDDVSLGIISSFRISKYEVNVWKKISENIDITALSMFYRLSGESVGPEIEVKGEWFADLGDDNGSRNQKWGKEKTIDLTDGLADGDYTLAIWFKAESGNGDKYLSNGSRNYNFKFTINSSYVESYYIAGNGTDGSDWCCGKDWVPDACVLNDGKVTYSQLPAGEYSFKITNGTWAKNWGYSSVDASCSTQPVVGNDECPVVKR